MTIPIIGNGDIDSPEVAKENFEKYGVDAIMIGRATYGRPWIFKEIKDYLRTGDKMIPFTTLQKVDIAKQHFSKSIEIKGGRTGIFEMRRHLSCYFKGLPHFKEMRLKLVTSNDPDEIFSLLDEVANRYGDYTVDDTINPSPWSK